jgi:hypothetical protein
MFHSFLFHAWHHLVVFYFVLATSKTFKSMALRAFHANPNIGGFGNENTAALLLVGPSKKPSNHQANASTNHRASEAGTIHPADESGDALCQIVKELVDNAVDACETARKQSGDSKVYRVKVEILPYNENGSDDGDDKSPLQVTVSDNGSGMKDIQACVNAFQSSKGGDDTNTAGRYGIGLTLCLLHAQRLVPGTYSCITSATKEAQSFKRDLYFVDTAGDTVECHREEEVAKGSVEESGTCVSLLVPVRNNTHELIASAFSLARKLSRSVHCATGRKNSESCMEEVGELSEKVPAQLCPM